MKNWIVMLFTLSIFTACNAGVDVPDAVKTAFMEKFPTAEKVKWEKEGKSEFEAEFKLNGIEMSAVFSPDGSWKATETEIEIAALPQNVADAIQKEYSGAVVKEAEMVESSDKGMFYEVEVKQGKEEFELVISADGLSISKEMEDED